MTATLAAIVFIPLTFIIGKSAELPRGTVFDAYTKRRVVIDTLAENIPEQSIDISKALGPKLEIEVCMKH